MLGVPSPSVVGHIIPRLRFTFDYNHLPLAIQSGSSRFAILDQQAFVHMAVSVAFFDRVLVSMDGPLAVYQSGQAPTVAGIVFPAPEYAGEAGDVKLGVRVRLFGADRDAFQVALAGYVHVPVDARSYVGDGAWRGSPELIVGGRASRFSYSASLGSTLRASTRPHTLDVRAGAMAHFADDIFRVGPELHLSTPFSREVIAETDTQRIKVASAVSAELLFGAKLRFGHFLVLGAGAGPGLTQGYGTPVFLGVFSAGFEPDLPMNTPDPDADGDKIVDRLDACPKTPGVASPDPKKNGCPPDRDGDGIEDSKDACPDVPGLPNEDPRKNGCPPDRDGDGIVDEKDACPDVPGVASPDPKKNGCPPDRDGDGIEDSKDACPDVPGAPNDDPKKNGCPPDRDGDGIADAKDACPDVPGPESEDPKENGCPRVTVTKTEIVITRQVRFRFGQSKLSQAVDPVSDDLLTEVRDAILKHPEIERIEVQGHADNIGPDGLNQELSQARAEAVRAWLIQKGIAPEKLEAKGYGSTAPVAGNESKQGRQQNRRVQFVILPKKAP